MIKQLEKIFFETEMTWKRVLLLSLICGVVPGLLMVPEFLKDTSFQQPGISYEFWILAAMYIILNCKKPLEAGLKTFVFFLISQPLIYLVQVPFCWLHWDIFGYYPEWGIITLFTLPGGMIAWYTKKGNWLSVLILSVANALLCVMIPSIFYSMITSFPRFLLSTVFMIAELIGFILLLFRGKKLRALAFVLAALLLAFGVFVEVRAIGNKTITCGTTLEGNPPFAVISGNEDAEIRTEDDNLWVTVKHYASFPVEVVDTDGNHQTIRFTYDETGAHWGERSEDPAE